MYHTPLGKGKPLLQPLLWSISSFDCMRPYFLIIYVHSRTAIFILCCNKNAYFSYTGTHMIVYTTTLYQSPSVYLFGRSYRSVYTPEAPLTLRHTLQPGSPDGPVKSVKNGELTWETITKATNAANATTTNSNNHNNHNSNDSDNANDNNSNNLCSNLKAAPCSSCQEPNAD